MAVGAPSVLSVHRTEAERGHGVGERVRIFLSSTWLDLRDERAAVEDVLHRMQDTDFNGMEYFGSRPETPREASLAEVDRSDLYIGIFGRRYGSGITEDEYRRARERRLPCLIYVLADDLLDAEDDTAENPDRVARRDALLRELDANHTVTYVGTPTELAAKVATDLHRELNNLRPRVTVPMSPQDRDNRRRMLVRVGTEVRRQIDESLHGMARIALGLEHRPEEVPDRWGQIIREHVPAEPTPLSARDIVDSFDDFDGEVLILGAPGSGKTTALLDLAVELIARAENDESLPMPVMFHLASWAIKRPPLADWLVSELASPRYDVPRKVARAWVDSDQILPLLDGLDEVAAEHRAACVAAINTYRKGRESRLSRLAICCRLAEYEDETLPQLELRGAVLVQPLTEAQVHDYLGAMGEQVVGLRSALQDDAELRELAATPLLLNVMVLTYQGMPAKSLPAGGTLEERRSELLTTYVERMFIRRGARAPYRPEQTVHWLVWLAGALSQHSQAIFHLENLQPDWLPTSRACRRYALVDRLGWGLIVWLTFGLVFGLHNWLTVGRLTVLLTVALPIGLFVGLLIGLMVGLLGGRSETSGETQQNARQLRHLLTDGARGLVYGLGVGLVSGPLCALGTEPLVGLFVVLGTGLFVGVFLMFASILTGGPSIRPRSVAIVETVGWSPSKAVRSGLVGGLIGGLFFLLAGALLVVVLGVSQGAPTYWQNLLVGGMRDGLAFGLGIGLVFGLVGGLTSGRTGERAVPNQGIRRSARQAIVLGLVSGLVSGLVVGLTVVLYAELVGDPGDGLDFGLFVGLIFGLVVGLRCGGQACLSHLALRYVLWREGVMPLNYVRFLEYATERIFLRRVGGGYMFVHRLVQEHFAANEEALVSRVAEVPTHKK